jgi:hypothetical protein
MKRHALLALLAGLFLGGAVGSFHPLTASSQSVAGPNHFAGLAGQLLATADSNDVVVPDVN